MVTVTYPGVYVQELPSGVHTITGVSTSNTGFVDFFRRGPVGEPVRVTSFAEFQRLFGGLDRSSEASYGLLQYFLNGGQTAWVMRLATATAKAATVGLPGDNTYRPGTAWVVDATNAGVWGNNIHVTVQHPSDEPGRSSFNLVVTETVNKRDVNQETYFNLSMSTTSPQYAKSVVNNRSALIQLKDQGLDRPKAGTFQLKDGNDGAAPNEPDEQPAWSKLLTDVLGGSALDKVDMNILCLPITALFNDDAAGAVLAAAQSFCHRTRAFLIIDIPEVLTKPDGVVDWVAKVKVQQDAQLRQYSALYFPRTVISDPLNQYRPRNVGCSGTLAGVYARTDANRGVWKAPAGTDAGLSGADVAVRLTDTENGVLNPLGYNAVRNFPVYGNIVWGARTLDGADQFASDYKYIPVRRLTNFIEQSLYNGTKWAVFEPNDATLWASLRLNVGAFMAGLAQQGAFYRYYVVCDDTTTTPADIERGICNIVVAFAPVKPAEFIVLQIQQLAGQSAA